MVHTLRLDNYYPTPRKLVLGTNSSFGTESIKIERGAGWDGLNLTATWHIPGREEPLRVALLDGDTMDVPPEVTKEAKDGVLVLAGLASGVQRASCNVEYLILEQAGVYGGADAEPTPELAAQVLEAALQAKADAEAAAEDAAAAKANADKAKSDAKKAQQAAENAAEDAAKAGPYAGDARAAQEAAESARDAAIAAQQAAKNAAAAAAASKSAADTLAADAARAAQAAENSKAAANNAAGLAGENATAAQQAAATATDAANDAGQSASDAAASKAAAETAAKAARDAQTAAAEAKAEAVKAQGAAQTAAKSAQDAQAAAEKVRDEAKAAQKGAEAARDAAANSAAAAKTSEDAAAKSAADANNTANSIKDSMTQIAANKEAVNQLKEDTAALQKRQNVLVGSETGNPIAVDDAFAAPLCGLTVYGRSTQDGTPTPEAPVPIVSAGDGGSVSVKVTGKNLLYLPDRSGTDRGVTVTAKNGLISISGTATESGYVALEISPFIVSGVAILSSSIASPSVALVSQTGGSVLLQNIANKMSKAVARLAFTVTQGQTYNLTGVKVQLELGTTATTYEPYHKQILTLLTPNGLPGIPVTSGSNYTDPQGQQFVCDEVDFERGILIRRIYSEIYTGAERWRQNNSGIFLNLSEAARDALKNTAISNIAVPCSGHPELSDSKPVGLRPTASGLSIGFFFVNNAQPTLDDWKTALSKTNAHVQYVLKKPIESKLTDAELAAYKALTTYAPDTVVQASDGAGIKLNYQRDVNLVVKNFEDAIASMTTT